MQRPPWWTNPGLVLLFMVLPLFLFAAYYAPQSLALNRIHSNYINAGTVTAGVLAILCAAAGCLFASFLTQSQATSPLVLERRKVFYALYFLGLSSLASLLYMLSTIIPAHMDLVIGALSGDPTATGQLYKVVDRVPGVTSIVHLRMLYFSLFAILLLDRNFQIPRQFWVLSVVLLTGTIAYGFLVSERIAILETAIAAVITPLAFKTRASAIRAASPIIGSAAVFGLFALGEYFRSWNYFRNTGVSFMEYISVRFIGYFSSSLNNGAGYITHIEPTFTPYMSASWFYKFPLWPILGVSFGPPPREQWDIFLWRYGSLEFNNYSGVYAVLEDFGIGLGCFILVFFGLMSGALYASFRRKDLLGLILYPVWIIGFLDIIRIFYWGESRFFPVLLVSVLVAAYLKPSQEMTLTLRRTALVPAG